MVEMLGTMLICESSDLEDDALVESEGDEMMKHVALNKIFTSADPMDRSLASIADISLNRDAFESDFAESRLIKIVHKSPIHPATRYIYEETKIDSSRARPPRLSSLGDRSLSFIKFQ